MIVRTCQRADVFVGVLLREGPSRLAGNALPGQVAWADVDGDWTPGRERALARFDTCWQVASGSGGRHVYVRLADPEEPARLEAFNRRLAVLLGADAGWSETKVLRPPGTWNHKPVPAARRPSR